MLHTEASAVLALLEALGAGDPGYGTRPTVDDAVAAAERLHRRACRQLQVSVPFQPGPLRALLTSADGGVDR